MPCTREYNRGYAETVCPHPRLIRQKLPEAFQRGEFLLKHGMLDAVVPRPETKKYISTVFRFFCDSA
jgi:acetyl-CoA carboxylase beta subunit